MDILIINPDAHWSRTVTRIRAQDGVSALDRMLAEDEGLRADEAALREALSWCGGSYTVGGGAGASFVLVAVEGSGEEAAKKPAVADEPLHEQPYCCPECGSLDIQIAAWTAWNAKHGLWTDCGDESPVSDQVWCAACQDHHRRVGWVGGENDPLADDPEAERPAA